MSSLRYTTPATLDAMKGKWGFNYDEKCCCSLSELLDVCITNLQNGDILIYNDVEECWENGPVPPGPPPIICMPDLCDVCYDPPASNPTDGQFLVYDVGTMCWENKNIEVCEDVVTGAFENLRIAETYIVDVPPVPPYSVSIPAFNQYPAGMSITMAVHNIWLNSSAISVGRNFEHDLLYYNGDLSQATTAVGLFWFGYNGGYTPILSAPSVSTPHITIPEGVCGRVALHNMSYAKLFSDRVDNGSLGVFFKIQNIADPTDEYYFQTPSLRTVAGGYVTASPLLPPLEWFQPYAWEITEVGSHSAGDNTVAVGAKPLIPGDRTYRLLVFYYTSPRYIDHTVITVQNGNVLNPFEIEPFFYLTFEKDNLNIT